MSGKTPGIGTVTTAARMDDAQARSLSGTMPGMGAVALGAAMMMTRREA